MKNRKRFIIFVIFAVSIISGALFVAAKKRGLTIPKSEEENLVVEEGSDVSQAENAETSIEEFSGLPSNFPEDFPIYPTAKIEDSFAIKGEGVEAQSVIWMVDGSIDEVSDFYKSELPQKGWEIDSTIEENDSIIFSFNKGILSGFAGIGETKEGLVVISVTIGADFEKPSL